MNKRIEELEAKIEENRAKNRALRKERVQMKKELRELKTQLKNNTNEIVEETTDVEEEKSENMTIEDKIKALDTPTIAQKLTERNVSKMTIEMQNNSLKEAFEKAMEEYPNEVKQFIKQYMDLYPVANFLLSLRALDDLIAQRYLNGEVNGAEFDHTRAWISIESYFYYKYMVEDVDMEVFFTEASLKASEKFMKEEEERQREYRNNDDDEDCGDDTTSSSSIDNNNDDDYGENPTIEFVSWTQESYAWCGSNVTIKVNGKEITLNRPLISGGSVWFDDDWNEHVEDGPWTVRANTLPDELKPYKNEIEKVINENIPEGCCGGCV